jgi:hypothetical protein
LPTPLQCNITPRAHDNSTAKHISSSEIVEAENRSSDEFARKGKEAMTNPSRTIRFFPRASLLLHHFSAVQQRGQIQRPHPLVEPVHARSRAGEKAQQKPRPSKSAPWFSQQAPCISNVIFLHYFAFLSVGVKTVENLGRMPYRGFANLRALALIPQRHSS